MIDHYAFGSMTINGRHYGKDVIILPDGSVISPWWRKTGHTLTMADIQTIVDAAPDLIIIGTGKPGLMRPVEDLPQTLQILGIETKIAPTQEAVKAFNTACDQETRVAGCFHLTC